MTFREPAPGAGHADMSDQNFFLAKTLFREFERKHLAFVGTLEDLDLVWAIGYGQKSGHPVGLKELVLADFGAPSTVQRRLNRLRSRKAIVQRVSIEDARRVEFHLTEETIHRLEAYKAFILENGMASRDPEIAAKTRSAGAARDTWTA
jgi:hypothetical protein